MTSLLLKMYGIALPLFCIFDLLWVGVVGKGFYQTYIGQLMRTEVKWWAIIAFYILFVATLVYFCIWPAVLQGSISAAALKGALFGFAVYMTYELVNYALIKNWSLPIVVIDVLWGVFICSIVSLITSYILIK